jgi:hypothetical protein
MQKKNQKALPNVFEKTLFFPVFVIVFQCAFSTVGGFQKLNIRKMKEVFVGNNPIHKNLSQFLHGYHGLGESKRGLRPCFPEIHQILGEFCSSVRRLLLSKEKGFETNAS